MGTAAYATLNGRPTFCGGYHYGGYEDGCYAYMEDGRWELVAALSGGKREMGFVKLSQDEMMVTGTKLDGKFGIWIQMLDDRWMEWRAYLGY